MPGRAIMVQGWYQGGVDVFDFTDVNHPVEIAYFDRGPIDANRMYTGGNWAATFSLPRAYLDRLARNKGLAADKIAAALTKAATTLEASAAGAADRRKAGLVVVAMRDLAKAKR